MRSSMLSAKTAPASSEPPRVCRRPQLLRGWGHGRRRRRRIAFHLKFGIVRFGWCGSTGATTARNGRRFCRSPRRSAARAESLRRWLRQAERDAGDRAGPTSDERARLKALERENRELRQANEILRKASAYFAQAELDRRFKP